MTQPTLIIYHDKCADGFTAAWAAQHLLPGPCELFAASYAKAGEPVELPDVTSRNVLMVDFCVGEVQLRELLGHVLSLRVFDHHASAERVCGQFECCTFDLERSGAGLTWDLLAQEHATHEHAGTTWSGKPRPWLINYVEDRDLWRHSWPNSKTVNAYIATIEHTLENWDLLAARDIRSVHALGEGAVAYRDHYVRSMLPEARRTAFLGHPDIPVINAPHVAASDLLGVLAEDALFAVGWFQRVDESYQYSLRSRGAFDVGALAQTVGGGGHPGAAGFRTGMRPVHLTWAPES